MLCLVGWKFC